MTSAAETVREIAGTDPDRIALRLGDLRVTYAELDAAASSIAARLLADLRPHSAVALVAHDSLSVAQATVGVHRAGMVLVPLDPTAPAERLREMLTDSGAALLLAEAAAGVPADEVPCPVLTFAEVLAVASDPVEQQDFGPAGLEMLLYTSGSTGTPKAVMKGVVSSSAVQQTAEELSFDEDDRPMAALSAGSLGASVSLLMVGLSMGRTVLPIEVRKTGLETLTDTLVHERAGSLVVVPTVLRFWLPTLPDDVRFPDLRVIAAFGEAMTGEDHNALAARLEPDADILNAYASTESGFATLLVRSAGDRAEPGRASAGRPATGVELTIVDESGLPVPDGDVGEIVVTSDATALGYWNRPELTKATFRELPDGRRSVRTGDQGSLQPDGTLMVLGRSDHVVKVSGNRVDLGDVEHALRAVPGVQDAAVAARVDAAGTTTLHGYLVPVAGDEPPHPSVVRSHLARRIPSWMLPVTLTALPELPRLANGKVDRRSLPDPRPVAVGAGDRPPTAAEAEIQRLWQEALGLAAVGLDDDFFVLGGDSMTAAAIMAELDRRHGVIRPVSMLVEAPTVAELAAALRGAVDDSVLVPVRAAGDLDPLVVVHGVFGEAFFAADVAAGVDQARPVYALRLPRDLHRAATTTTLEQLATRYVDALLAVQPDGPYRIFGYSAGGVVGFEMTRQLEAAGRRVELLVLGDSPAPGSRVEVSLDAPARGRAARLRQLRSSGVRDGARLAAQLLVNQARHRAALVRKAARPDFAGASAGARIAAEQQARQRAEALGALLVDYRPAGGVTATVRLLRANLPGDVDLGWSALTGGVAVTRVSCDHFAMVHQPFVRELGGLLEQAIVGGRDELVATG